MTTIYFTNHQKRQLTHFLNKYPPCIIYVKNVLNVNFESLQSNKTKSISALTLNELSMLLPKDVSNNFTKINF